MVKKLHQEAGISFEVLCVVRIVPGQPTVFREGMPQAPMKIRYDSINGTLYNTNADDTIHHMQYLQKIRMINDGYHAPDIVEWFRSIQSIDPSRHPQFPDDILVWFIKDGEKPEGIWCRVHGFNNN